MYICLIVQHAHAYCLAAIASIDKVGTGYILVATCGALPVASSSAINIIAGKGVQIGIMKFPPAFVAAGMIWPVQPVIAVQDLGGNTDFTSSATVEMGVTGAGCSLSGTLQVKAVNGIATFSGLGYKTVAKNCALTCAIAKVIVPAGPAPTPAPTPAATPVDGATRFVRVTSTQNQHIQIAQLVVLNSEGTNVAKGKPATASNSWSNKCFSCPVDGTLSARNYPSIFHDAVPQSGNFWQVDLGTLVSVASITYYNRRDCCTCRAQGMVISLLDASKKEIAKGIVTTCGASQTFVFNSPPAPLPTPVVAPIPTPYPTPAPTPRPTFAPVAGTTAGTAALLLLACSQLTLALIHYSRKCTKACARYLTRMSAACVCVCYFVWSGCCIP